MRPLDDAVVDDPAAVHTVFEENLTVVLRGPVPHGVVDSVVSLSRRPAAVGDVINDVAMAVLVAAAAARKVSGLPRRCKLTHAFPWGYS